MDRLIYNSIESSSASLYTWRISNINHLFNSSQHQICTRIFSPFCIIYATCLKYLWCVKEYLYWMCSTNVPDSISDNKCQLKEAKTPWKWVSLYRQTINGHQFLPFTARSLQKRTFGSISHRTRVRRRKHLNIMRINKQTVRRYWSEAIYHQKTIPVAICFAIGEQSALRMHNQIS